MFITESQKKKVERIDVFVKATLRNGGSDEDILIGMYDYTRDSTIFYLKSLGPTLKNLNERFKD